MFLIKSFYNEKNTRKLMVYVHCRKYLKKVLFKNRMLDQGLLTCVSQSVWGFHILHINNSMHYAL